jgi:Ca2+-transporting ATPase
MLLVATIALTTLVVDNAFLTFRWPLDQGTSLARRAHGENRSLFSLSPVSNRFPFLASVVALGIRATALHVPPTQYVLGVEPIGLGVWLRAAAIATTVLVAAEATRRSAAGGRTGRAPAS